VPYHPHTTEKKPDIPPSYEVHISPTTTPGTSSSAGPGFCVLRDYDLKTILSVVTGKNATRILLPASLENNHGYDFVLVLPRPENKAAIDRLLQQGIEKYFQVSITLEERTTDVYVMTAQEGETPKETDSDGNFSCSRLLVDRARTGFEISAFSHNMSEFRSTLEQTLQLPIVDETNLQGTYDLALNAKARNTADFLQQLRDQLGLVLTPAQRRIEMIVVKKLQGRMPSCGGLPTSPISEAITTESVPIRQTPIPSKRASTKSNF
jgi:uncharacterized protein (TIGR03435 family)